MFNEKKTQNTVYITSNADDQINKISDRHGISKNQAFRDLLDYSLAAYQSAAKSRKYEHMTLTAMLNSKGGRYG